MSTQLASAFFDEPTPLIPTVPRKISRPTSTMTCPECDLKQAVALDCAGCGRIMKPSTDFRLADPLLAPSTGLESLEPVEAVVPARAEPPARFTVHDVQEAQGEGTPWLKMAVSLLLCWLAWDLNDRLVSLETAASGTSGSLWIELAQALGREGTVAGLIFFAAVLMVVSARQVLSGH